MSATSSHTWTIRGPADLGRAIAGVRKANGLRQADLAERAAIDRTYLAKLEAGGTSSIQLDRALRALRRMGATVTVTFSGTDAPSD